MAQSLGFVPVPEANINLGGRTYYSAMLDFGPASVMLDVEARELVSDSGADFARSPEADNARHCADGIQANETAGRESPVPQVELAIHLSR